MYTRVFNFYRAPRSPVICAHVCLKLRTFAALPTKAPKTSSPTPALLNLTGSWKHYGGAFGNATMTVANGICVVDGLIKHSGWNSSLAQLPTNCRPTKRLVFNLNNHAKICRVDVFPSGAVTWMSGGKDHAWISLSGISFVTTQSDSKANTLALESSWRSYGGSFGNATWRVIADGKGGRVCFVEGLIRGGNWYWEMFTLPTACRPNKRLVFEVNNHAKQTRVDVLQSGQVKRYSGGRDYGWISLAGIVFMVGASGGQRVLNLTHGWRNHGNAYGPATVAKFGEICMVEGLAYDGTFNQSYATLPMDCRPNKRLIMNTNNHANSARSDVAINGSVQYVTGSRDTSWMSLTGITFVAAGAN